MGGSPRAAGADVRALVLALVLVAGVAHADHVDNVQVEHMRVPSHTIPPNAGLALSCRTQLGSCRLVIAGDWNLDYTKAINADAGVPINLACYCTDAYNRRVPGVTSSAAPP